MQIPKVIGIETEYGIVTQALVESAARHDPIAASRAVVREVTQVGILAAPQHTMTGWTEFIPERSPWRVIPVTTPLTHLVSEESGWMLANGARVYVDHAHPEYCTPECLTPHEVVAADKAGELLLERCRQRANAASDGLHFRLYKNNSDHKGNSYGCHENYLLAAELYEALLVRRPTLVTSLVIPFFISRTILCGAGKVGSENGTPPAGFQLAQRADFFETLIGVQTTHRRPLFNTRDEAHAAARFRRLHVIMGDANLAEFSTFLKVGTAQLFLRMLEADFLHQDYTLADPLAALQTVSRDLDFVAPLPLAAGGTTTALDLQCEWLRCARQYCEQMSLSNADSAVLTEVLEEWEEALACLATDWRLLATRLDWAIKRNLLEKYLQAHERTWEDLRIWQPVIEEVLQAEAAGPQASSAVLRKHRLPEKEFRLQRQLYFGLRRLDLEYHDICRGSANEQAGLFYRLQQRGAIERLLDDEAIERLLSTPPESTRARLRGRYLTQHTDAVVWADWSCLQLAGPVWGYPQGVILTMDDPLLTTPQEDKEL